MSVDYNLSVPVPPGAIVSRNSRRVSVNVEKSYNKKKKHYEYRRRIIGWTNSSDFTTMNPSEYYAELFPDEYNKARGEILGNMIKRYGLFLFSLAAGTDSGLYETLVKSCGPAYANFIMDFAMYSIEFKSNVAKDFETAMKDQVLYSDTLYSDSWISEFFKTKINVNHIENFKQNWLKTCKEKGIKKVWICIDGSNDDTAITNSALAEKGKAKSHKNSDIYAYIYAVNAEDGTPVTYSLYRGSRVDSKGLQEIIAYLKASGFEVEGVILDRGFCDSVTVNTVVDCGYKYVIMMKESTNGFKSMMQKFGKKIPNNVEYLTGPGIFAVVDKDKIFTNSKNESYIALVYDVENAAGRIKKLTGNVLEAMKKFKKAVKEGKTYTIPDKVKNCLTVDEGNNSITYSEEFQTELDQKGFYALACSEPFSAPEILALYDLRDVSEKLFSEKKTQLGCHTGRAHDDEGLAGRNFTAFIALIIRNELKKHCKEIGLDLPTAIKELNFLILSRMINDKAYITIPTLSGSVKKLLKSVGLKEDSLGFLAKRETCKESGKAYDQIAKIPEEVYIKKKKTVSTNVKPASEPAKANTDHPEQEEPPKKRGRKPGSKNRPKEVIEEEKRMKAARKGQRGRPKGSKNKPKV